MQTLPDLLVTGQVVRYHANPFMNRFHQTNADHSWGVVVLIVQLHPNPSPNLLKAAVFHDSGEYLAGDLASPFKQAHPDVAKAHAEVEHRLAREYGVPQFELTEEEEQWLKLCDMLESYLYMRHCGQASQWTPNGKINKIKVLARVLGCEPKVQQLMEQTQ